MSKSPRRQADRDFAGRQLLRDGITANVMNPRRNNDAVDWTTIRPGLAALMKAMRVKPRGQSSMEVALRIARALPEAMKDEFQEGELHRTAHTIADALFDAFEQGQLTPPTRRQRRMHDILKGVP